MMHELWHFYYFSFFGDAVVKQYDQTISNTIKEALTVLLNEEFADLMLGVTDLGYPQHAALRDTILTIYKETHNISQTIYRSLPTLA